MFVPILTDLTALVDRLAAVIPDLNLDGDEQEEYSTMLLWLQNQVETGEPSEAIVESMPRLLPAIRIPRGLKRRIKRIGPEMLVTGHCNFVTVLFTARRIREERIGGAPLLPACCNVPDRCATFRLSAPLEGAPSN